MKKIETIEKYLPPKRKDLLYALRENNWEVIEIKDAHSDWAYDQQWIIKSTRENKGFTLLLWFFKYDGRYDGMNRVAATPFNASQPNAYVGDEPSIEFDGRKFEPQLASFIKLIHEIRRS